jgi:Cft2 family RNA processing exonuclease
LLVSPKKKTQFLERRLILITVGWLDGVVISTIEGLIRFDPHSRRNRAGTVFISHAHGDHIRGLNPNVEGYVTAETKEILLKRKKVPYVKDLNTIRYGEKVVVNGLQVTAHNSGHVLGSSLYEITNQESTIVYTGDINCRDMLTTNAAKVVPCDVLILETTYGKPFYAFPSLIDVHARILNWVIHEIQKKRVPTFKVYSVGKAQEIVKLMNKFTNIPVVTSHEIAKINEAYNTNGVKLTYTDASTEAGKKLFTQPCVQVITTHEPPPITNCCSYALATGWALKFNHNSADAAFPLSNHADFNQLVEYVKRSQAKEIYTIHGFKESFAQSISKKLGIKAMVIPPLKQSSLRTFL